MKQLLAIVAVGVMVVGTSVRAQQNDVSSDQQLHRLSERLKLSDSQMNQIRSILQDRHEKLQGILLDRAHKQDRTTLMQKVFEDANEKVRAILTEEQKKRFDQITYRGRTRKRG